MAKPYLIWEKPSLNSCVHGIRTLVLSGACGGSVFLSVGQTVSVTSPGFPLAYPHDTECLWTLQTPIGFRPQLTVRHMDLEPSTACPFDSLTVEGANIYGLYRPVTIFCNETSVGSTASSQGNLMRLRFKSDYSLSGTGFNVTVTPGSIIIVSFESFFYCLILKSVNLLASFKTLFDASGNHIQIFTKQKQNKILLELRLSCSAVCGGSLMSQSGYLTSPNFPSPYPPRTTCEWTVMVRWGRTIQMEFTDFNLGGSSGNCNRDYVTVRFEARIPIRNGENVDAPHLTGAILCGSSPPDLSRFNTSSNAMHVKFVSDSYGQNQGFRLYFHETTLGCGGTIHLSPMGVSEATISTPNFPERGPGNAECEWTVIASQGKRVQLDFFGRNSQDFGLYGTENCTLEAVEVYDGAHVTSPLMASLCALSHLTSRLSSSNALFIRYFTNRWGTVGGFRAKVKIATCGGSFHATTGMISSPGYPGSYEPNLNCQWMIDVPWTHAVTISMISFGINYNANCSVGDFLRIREFNSTGEVLATICGTPQSNPEALLPISSAGSKVFVEFVTRGQGRSGLAPSGFRLRFNSSYFESIQYKSHANITGGGTKWRRAAEFKRECPSDTAEANASNLFSSDTFFGSPRIPIGNGSYYYCGTTIPPPIRSSSNGLQLQYYNRNGELRGFQAHYDTNQPAYCGGMLNANSGSFSSPGYPVRPYNSSIACLWQWHSGDPSNGTSLQITFDAFSLRGSSFNCWGDVLVISVEGEVNQRLCGNITDHRKMSIPYSTVTFSFKALRGTNRMPGFRISYRSLPCGGAVTSPRTLVSPGFPTSYATGIDCIWHVQFSEGSQVKVKRHEKEQFRQKRKLGSNYVKKARSQALVLPTATQG
ncbi:unnamed protein product [Cyprideis torosa]|uniref:Uncharacterized protein n=1 Tax=Cyprideis torosa TaxID=163714 RepID=A0A7R8WBF7_9CRUS|nr:unnamed protein product [Cyprideis torosa]CAG0892089.1 unnamed protein product [Cyprideis torosa]